MRAKDELTHAAEIVLARVVEDDLLANGGSRRGIHVQRRKVYWKKLKNIQTTKGILDSISTAHKKNPPFF